MTTEHVSHRSACPACGLIAWWHITRNTEAGGDSRTRIVCDTCGDTDPAVSFAAVITDREGAKA